MKTYLISYDLIRPSTNPEYFGLYNFIKSLPYWAKPLESVWLVKTDIAATQIINSLRAVTDANDKLLVIQVTNAWVAYNLPPTVVQWMQGGL